MYLEFYLVVIDFVILEGDNLHELFPAASFRLGAIHIGGKQVFVSWFSNLNMFALVSAVLIAAILWVRVFDGVGFRERVGLVHWDGMPSAMSLYSFCFSDVFPMIYMGMEDRKRFSMVL
jgi:vesicular inhibitory amino acid transporter